jgi:hypothetical protein
MKDMEKAGTLLPTEATTEQEDVPDEPRKVEIMQPRLAEVREETPEEEQARVFAKLKEMKVAEEPEEDAAGDAEPEAETPDDAPEAEDAPDAEDEPRQD